MTRCIMAVNDDREILDMLDVLLPQEGYHVARSTTTEAAPAAIEQIQPDLILLDCMSGVEARGYDLLQQVKLNPATATIPVVVCSTPKDAQAQTVEVLRSTNVA